jgi:hypothetical protein
MKPEAWRLWVGAKTKLFQQRVHESSAEFNGRAWCEVEAVLGRGPGDPPVPAGTRIVLDRSSTARWAELPSWEAEVYESTGEPYENRWRFLTRVGHEPDWKRLGVDKPKRR